MAPAQASAPARGLGGVWASYAALGAVGYVIYGLGAVGPYLRERLRLSDAELGLHSTALAVGLIAAGVLTADLGRRLGERAIRGLAITCLAVAIALIGTAQSIAVTLAGGGLIGFGAGTLLGYANASLSAAGGAAARRQLARGNVWAMVAAFAAPLALASAAVGGWGWSLGLAPAAGLLIIVALDLRLAPSLPVGSGQETGATGLPRAFWRAWTYVVAVVAVEFAIVFWAATLVERRAGVSVPEATSIAALFLGGMFAGRLAMGYGLAAGRPPRQGAWAALSVVAAGGLLAWITTTPIVAGAALFVAGLGVAGLYPLGVAAALATAPDRLALAGNRLTIASGLAILVAPLALGAIADVTGVVAGWGLVLALVVAGFGFAAGLSGEPDQEAGRS
jgi:MFS family permease